MGIALRLCLLLLLALASRAAAADAATHWTRIRSGQEDILTTAGEPEARALASLLRETRERMAAAFPYVQPAASPVRVVAFADAAEARPYLLDAQSAAYYIRNGNEDRIVLTRVGAAAAEMLRHEYLHLLLSRSRTRLPQWLEEGLATFYADQSYGGGTLAVGGRMARWYRQLRGPRQRVATSVLESSRDRRLFSFPPDRVDMYGAGAALAHLLAVDPRFAPGLSRFLAALAAGAGAPDALQSVYGCDLADLDRAVERFLAQGRWPGLRLPLPAQPAADALAIAAAEPAEVDLELAWLLERIGRAGQARQAYTDALARTPQQPLGWARLAHLDVLQGDLPRALERFAHAWELGLSDPGLLWEYARWNGPGAATAAVLERLLQVDPEHTPARLLLADMDLRAGRASLALSRLERLASLTPEQRDYVAQATGYAQRALALPGSLP